MLAAPERALRHLARLYGVQTTYVDIRGGRQHASPAILVRVLRALGAAVIRRAIIAKDTAEEQGRNPNPLALAIARLPRRLGYLLGP